MAEVRTVNVRAERFDDIDAAMDKAGAFEFYKIGEKYPAGIIYNCPCGCKAQGSLAFKPAGNPSWSFDGNMERPTLHPSVNHRGHWHGWLIRGVWTHDPGTVPA